MIKLLKKYKLKIIITLLVVILGIGSVIYVKHLMNSPAQGDVVLNNEDVAKDQKLTTEPKSFSGEFFTAKYPARYELKKNQNKTASLESWQLIAHQQAGGLLSATIVLIIEALPTGGLAASSPMQNFTAHPELYKLSKVTYGGEQTTLAEKTNGGYERTLLWPHSAHLLSVSMTSSQKTTDLTGEFDMILANLLWSL